MVEERHLTMDGRAFDVEVVAAPVSIGGRPAVVLAARDITERKATEACSSCRATRATSRRNCVGKRPA
jgi:PAS domain S-box-containing protein